MEDNPIVELPESFVKFDTLELRVSVAILRKFKANGSLVHMKPKKLLLNGLQLA
jgi:hypothetical protein